MLRARTTGPQDAPSRLIERRRLFRRLDRDWPSPLTVVTAPAGFGKTTAIESWLRHRDERVVWIGLDEDDNDPVLLWSRILAEAGRAHGLGAAASVALGSTLGSPRAAIELFASEVRAAEVRLVLVLDDVHVIMDSDCLRTIELAARLMAGSVALVLLTRHEPALPLDRLHGRGQLMALGSADLAFDQSETRELLDRYTTRLDSDAVDTVFRVTGGWPAAVYMSALWLRDAPDPSAAARGMERAQEQLTDYLLTEVIGGLDSETTEFLRRTSVLPRLNGPLCDDVLRRTGSTATIERLWETNLLVKNDRRRQGWHRYHPLLRGVLLHQIDDREPELAAVLRRRAADWFMRDGRPEDAAELAREGGDYQLLADLLRDLHLDLLRCGRAATLLRWGDALPDDVLEDRPDVTMPVAMVAENAGRPALEVRRLLARADVARRAGHLAWTDENEVEWQMLRAGSGEAGIGASVEAARAAVAVAERVPGLRHVSWSVLSFFLELAGDRDAAESVARSVVEDPDVGGRPFAHLLASGTLALVELARDRPRSARRHVEQALDVIDRAGLEDGPISARIYTCEALLCLAEGDAAAARRAAELSLRHPFDTAPLLGWTLLVAADARAHGGDFRAAREALAHAGELLDASPDPGRLPALRAQVTARVEAIEASGAALPVPTVSPAEMRVLRLLDEDLTRAQIAARLVLSVNTVKAHQRSLYRKFGVGDRDIVVALAKAHGLID